MSQKVKEQKFIRREIRRKTDALGQQMMKNTIMMPLRQRIRVALIIIFKRAM